MTSNIFTLDIDFIGCNKPSRTMRLFLIRFKMTFNGRLQASFVGDNGCIISRASLKTNI